MKKMYLRGITALVFLLAASFVLFTACPEESGTTDIIPTPGPSGVKAVTSIEIYDASETLVSTTEPLYGVQGSTLIFDYEIKATSGTPKTVTWALTGTTNPGTTLTNGRLIIAANETANAQLKVRVTSDFDETKFYEITVIVRDKTSPSVTSVAITGTQNPTVAKGGQLQFSWVVDVENDAAKTVAWTVTGNTSAQTTISAAGLLTVAAAETAQSVIVRVASTVTGYENRADTRTVTITGGGGPPGPNPDPVDFDGVVYSDGIFSDKIATYELFFELWGATGDGKTPSAEAAQNVSGDLHDGHTQALAMTGIGQYGTGVGILFQDNVFNLGDFTALTFWAKSSANMTVDFVQFGTGTFSTEYGISYSGEDNKGIALTPTWKKFIVPIPKKNATTVRLAFSFWVPVSELGKIAYFDDIKFVNTPITLTSITLKDHEPISSVGNTPITDLTYQMKATYSVDGGTGSLFNGNIDFSKYHSIEYSASGGATINGQNLVPGAGGSTFAFNVKFDGLITGTLNGTVATGGFLYLEDCQTKGMLTYEWNYGDHPGVLNSLGYIGDAYYKAITTLDGKDCISIMNKVWVNNSNTGELGRNGGPWNLTQMNKVTFQYRVTTGETSQDFPGTFSGGTLNLTLGNVASTAITLTPANVNNWQNGTFTLTGAQKANITTWKLTFVGNPNNCSAFINVTALKAEQ